MRALVGTSGFAHEDWKGVFYPPDLPREDWIRYYSMFFPFVEIDSSYYRMPEAWRLEELAAATPKDFLFAIQAHRSLTHEIHSGWLKTALEFKAALNARSFKSRLAGILFQFPHRFRYDDPNRIYLGELTNEFSGFPLFLEFRNNEWSLPAVAAEAEKRHIGLVAVDAPDAQPAAAGGILITAAAAYVRFHGRNAEAWWSGDGLSRYDYTYSVNELRDWAQWIAEAEKKASMVLTAFNNFPHGNAVLDAKRLKGLLDDERSRLETFAETPR